MAYRGVTARLPVGAQGFTGTLNPSQAGPGHFLYTDGAELDAGIIRKEGGALMYNQALPAHGGLLDISTKVLLHMQGIDGSVYFPDTNPNNAKLWTPAGNAQVDTADSKFGGSSLLLDGTGDWISTPDSNDFNFTTVDFTIDCWFKCVAVTGGNVRLAGQNAAVPAASTTSFIIDRDTSNHMRAFVGVGAAFIQVTGTTAFTNLINPGWHHLALVRSNNLLLLFIDGVLEGSNAIVGTVNNATDILSVGTAGAETGIPWNGWIDEFRLTNGIARWTANFTPPTAAYADYTTEPSRAVVLDLDTKILLHFEGADASTTFTESSLFTRTWTAAGNAQIDTADFRVGTASGLFDGTGDWITTPDSSDFTLGTNNFTVDFWFKCNAAGGTLLWLCGQQDGAGTATTMSIQVFRQNTNVIQAFACVGAATHTVSSISTFTNAVNTGWHHCAFVRSGANLLLFIDGVLEGSSNTIGAGSVNDSPHVFGVGITGAAAGNGWNGWIDEFRFVNGVAKWTLPFVPPGVGGTPYIVNGSNAGLVAFGTLPTSVQTILAGIYWPNAAAVGSAADIIAVSGGAILAASAGGFSTVCRAGLASLPTDPPPYFMFGGGEAVGAGRKLFMFSQNNMPQVSTVGTLNMGNISAAPADWSGGNNFPTFGVLHAFRIFAGGNLNDPHRLYYSQNTDHTNFTGAGSGTLAIYPGEGEKIVGAISFRGALIVWKYPNHIYVVDTTDPTPTNWKVDRLTRAIGGVNQHAIVQIENDVAFLDRSGNIHLLTAVNEFGDVNTSNLSQVADIAPWIRANINMSNFQRAVGNWYAGKRQLWFGMAQLASQVNNIRMVTTFAGMVQGSDQQAGVGPRFFLSRRDVLTALWSKPDPNNGVMKPMIGDDAGFVWYLDQDARNKNGSGYPIQFQTASTDIAFVDQSLATKQKNGQFLELAFEPRGNWDLTVDIFWDDIYFETLTFNMGGTGATLGSFTLDTDILGSEGARSVRQRMEGSGRRFKMNAINSGANQDISLSEFHISFGVGDERIQT